MAQIRGMHVPKYAYWVIMKADCPEPFCRASATWLCTTKGGKDSSTPHIKRTEAYWETDHGKDRKAWLESRRRDRRSAV